MIWARLLAGGLLATLLVAPAAQAQEAPSTSLPTALNFSVGLPSDPVSMRAGDTVQKTAAITNSGVTGTDFNLSITSVDVGDNGQVTAAEDRSDPLPEVVSVPSTVRVEAGATVDVPLTIRPTDTFDPDIYFAGLLVQPAQNAAANGTVTVTRLLNVIAVDIVGAQYRGVEVSFLNPQRLLIGSKLSGDYRIYNRNAGVSLARRVTVHGTVITDPTSTDANGLQNTSRDTIARGHQKTYRFDYPVSGFVIRSVRPVVSVTYLDNGAERIESRTGSATLVVSPIAAAVLLATLAVVMLAGLVLLIRRRNLRRRRAANSPASNEPLEPSVSHKLESPVVIGTRPKPTAKTKKKRKRRR